MGMILLGISAFIQSVEIIIENRLFLIDPTMSSFYMFAAVSTWKMIFTILILPFLHLIPVPESYVTGGKLESLGPALKLLFSNSVLIWLFFFMALSNGLHAVFGMGIIKNESAMQRQTA